MKSKVLSSLLAFVTITILGGESFAQKKSEIAYFSREVTIKDSITLSLINQYIREVGQQKEKVVHMAVGLAKDTIYFRLEAIAHIESVTSFKPFFLFQHKGYYFLIDNGVGRMLHGNEAYSKYIIKKLKKYLVAGYKVKDLGGGVKDVTMSTFDPPVMHATFSRISGVKVWWEGL